jgi:hypothetical protein
MKKQAYGEAAAEKLLPLLLSIGREIKNRVQAINGMEEALEKRAPGLDVATTTARLAIEKRELRTTLRELERLGCDLDPDHPLRILIPGLNGPMAFEGSLEKTMFRFRRSIEEEKPA